MEIGPATASHRFQLAAPYPALGPALRSGSGAASTSMRNGATATAATTAQASCAAASADGEMSAQPAPTVAGVGRTVGGRFGRAAGGQAGYPDEASKSDSHVCSPVSGCSPGGSRGGCSGRGGRVLRRSAQASTEEQEEVGGSWEG